MSVMPRNRQREAPEMASFMRRMARALGRRAGDGDLEALSAIKSSRAALDEALGVAVLGALDFGYSWAEVAAELGVTKQAAWKRWGQMVEQARAERENNDQESEQA